MADLLLYSLAESREIIFATLDAVRPARVVEVGSEAGTFTRELGAWAEEHGCRLFSVDPHPSDQTRDQAAGSPAITLVEERSPGGLQLLEPADVYLLDGDHNYHTVRGELDTIAARTWDEGRDAVVLAQDVGWPCGRRDAYYDPGSLPAEGLHPFSAELGVTPGQPDAQRGGYRGAGAMAFALREGGPRNGVMTAVEDFLRGRDGLHLAVVPSVFGLAIIYPEGAPFAGHLAEVLRPWDRNPMLERLERNRVDLIVALIAAQDAWAERLLRHDRELRGRDLRISALEARCATLEEEVRAARDREGGRAAESTAGKAGTEPDGRRGLARLLG